MAYPKEGTCFGSGSSQALQMLRKQELSIFVTVEVSGIAFISAVMVWVSVGTHTTHFRMCLCPGHHRVPGPWQRGQRQEAKSGQALAFSSSFSPRNPGGKRHSSGHSELTSVFFFLPQDVEQRNGDITYGQFAQLYRSLMFSAQKMVGAEFSRAGQGTFPGH